VPVEDASAARALDAYPDWYSEVVSEVRPRVRRRWLPLKRKRSCISLRAVSRTSICCCRAGTPAGPRPAHARSPRASSGAHLMPPGGSRSTRDPSRARARRDHAVPRLVRSSVGDAFAPIHAGRSRKARVWILRRPRGGAYVYTPESGASPDVFSVSLIGWRAARRVGWVSRSNQRG